MYNSALSFTSLGANIDETITGTRDKILNNVNPYVKTFHQASNMLRSNQLLNMKIVITDCRIIDPRYYNTLRAVEFAVIMV
ncbi:12948_t:CDS:2 [Funneliformis mosseae]|uniref:12948_t:CDS:1 n=1 Tax=Funneliformis mosseae TaxID=27381 RepID=A0A9N9BUN5_FUNMO|nr:12948_t:CDS:2 [Funneliformis mosseae]